MSQPLFKRRKKKGKQQYRKIYLRLLAYPTGVRVWECKSVYILSPFILCIRKFVVSFTFGDTKFLANILISTCMYKLTSNHYCRACHPTNFYCCKWQYRLGIWCPYLHTAFYLSILSQIAWTNHNIEKKILFKMRRNIWIITWRNIFLLWGKSTKYKVQQKQQSLNKKFDYCLKH